MTLELALGAHLWDTEVEQERLGRWVMGEKFGLGFFFTVLNQILDFTDLFRNWLESPAFLDPIRTWLVLLQIIEFSLLKGHFINSFTVLFIIDIVFF